MLKDFCYKNELPLNTPLYTYLHILLFKMTAIYIFELNPDQILIINWSFLNVIFFLFQHKILNIFFLIFNISNDLKRFSKVRVNNKCWGNFHKISKYNHNAATNSSHKATLHFCLKYSLWIKQKVIQNKRKHRNAALKWTQNVLKSEVLQAN